MNFYISDTHWGHKNVINFDHRPFADREEMEQDSVLIVDPEYGSIICRYFPNWGSAEFYAVNANEPQKGTSYLIHNTGKDELVIRFERYSKKWTIKPGKSKTIVPYRADGADGEEEILCQ